VIYIGHLDGGGSKGDEPLRIMMGDASVRTDVVARGVAGIAADPRADLDRRAPFTPSDTVGTGGDAQKTQFQIVFFFV